MAKRSSCFTRAAQGSTRARWGQMSAPWQSAFASIRQSDAGMGGHPTLRARSASTRWRRTMVAFIERVVGEPVHLVGSSDGAIVGLLAALRRPELVRRLVLAAGVFHRDGWVPQAIDPDNTPPEFLRGLYGELSPDGIDHYPMMVAKLAEMHQNEPTLTAHDLRAVRSRTLVMVGDDDEVSLEHAIDMYRAIPDAELAVVPGTSHGLLVEKPALCNQLILDFLTTDPVPTMAPIRRATTAQK
jgi:pimeloyl-ACP methyl ester carboxylesterase